MQQHWKKTTVKVKELLYTLIVCNAIPAWSSMRSYSDHPVFQAAKAIPAKYTEYLIALSLSRHLHFFSLSVACKLTCKWKPSMGKLLALKMQIII